MRKSRRIIRKLRFNNLSTKKRNGVFEMDSESVYNPLTGEVEFVVTYGEYMREYTSCDGCKLNKYISGDSCCDSCDGIRHTAIHETSITI